MLTTHHRVSVLSPTKITLIGAVLFALQQTHYLPVKTHHLMLVYTVFTVVNKVSVEPTPEAPSDNKRFGCSAFAPLWKKQTNTCITCVECFGGAYPSESVASCRLNDLFLHVPFFEA